MFFLNRFILTLISASSLASILTFAGSALAQQSQAGPRQKCTTVLECSQLSVEQASAARAALEADKQSIEAVRSQLNQYKVELEDKIAATDKTLAELKGVHLECTSVLKPGQSAQCAAEYTVTGCTAGKNYASTDLGINRAINGCFTHLGDTDWTQARCCRVSH